MQADHVILMLSYNYKLGINFNPTRNKGSPLFIPFFFRRILHLVIQVLDYEKVDYNVYNNV